MKGKRKEKKRKRKGKERKERKGKERKEEKKISSMEEGNRTIKKRKREKRNRRKRKEMKMRRTNCSPSIFWCSTDQGVGIVHALRGRGLSYSSYFQWPLDSALIVGLGDLVSLVISHS